MYVLVLGNSAPFVCKFSLFYAGKIPKPTCVFFGNF